MQRASRQRSRTWALWACGRGLQQRGLSLGRCWRASVGRASEPERNKPLMLRPATGWAAGGHGPVQCAPWAAQPRATAACARGSTRCVRHTRCRAWPGRSPSGPRCRWPSPAWRLPSRRRCWPMRWTCFWGFYAVGAHNKWRSAHTAPATRPHRSPLRRDNRGHFTTSRGGTASPVCPPCLPSPPFHHRHRPCQRSPRCRQRQPHSHRPACACSPSSRR